MSDAKPLTDDEINRWMESNNLPRDTYVRGGVVYAHGDRVRATIDALRARAEQAEADFKECDKQRCELFDGLLAMKNQRDSEREAKKQAEKKCDAYRVIAVGPRSGVPIAIQVAVDAFQVSRMSDAQAADLSVFFARDIWHKLREFVKSHGAALARAGEVRP